MSTTVQNTDSHQNTGLAGKIPGSSKPMQQPKNVYKVTLVGTEGTGKTCFFAGLALEGFNTLEKTPFLVFPETTETRLSMNSLAETLRRGYWPPATVMTVLLDFSVVNNITGSSLRLLTIDYPGEDFRHAYNELSPGSMKIFSEHLKDSDVVLLLVDANDIRMVHDEASRNVINNKLRAELAAVWELVAPTADDPRSPERTIDLGIVITKSDQIKSLKTAVKRKMGSKVAKWFILKNLGQFDENLRRVANIGKIGYFPVSSVGETMEAEEGADGAPLPDPDSLKPFGYDAIFQWIAKRSNRSSKRSRGHYWFFAYFLPFVLLMGLLGGLLYLGKKAADSYEETRITKIFQDDYLSSTEKLEYGRSPFSNTPKMQQARNQMIDDELNRLRNRVDEALDSQTLQEIREEIFNFEKTGAGVDKHELNLLKQQIAGKLMENDFQRIKQAFELKSSQFFELASTFLENYPDTPRADEVKKMFDAYDLDHLNQAKRRIMEVIVRDASQLVKKAELIHSFLEEFEKKLKPEEVEQMRRATALAKKFAEGSSYRVTLKQYGGFAYQEDQIMKITIGNRPSIVFPSESKVKDFNPDKTFEFEWKSGDAIHLELQAYAGIFYGGLETVASEKSSAPDAIRLLSERRSLNPWRESWDWSLPKYMAPGGFFVDFVLEGITPEDWNAFESYIKPGNAWKVEP